MAVLLTFLGYSICKGFDGHLTAAERMVVRAASRTAFDESPIASSPAASINASAAASASQHQAKSNKSKAKTDVRAASPTDVAASTPESTLQELLSTSVKAIASTTVAVIWVLVIAIAVITIAIARAVLLLKPQGLESSADGEKTTRPDSAAVALPGLEFAKEVIKLIGDTTKSVSK